MKTMMMAIVVAASLLAACGGKSNNPDLGPPFDMQQPPCVMNPSSGTDFLNACTDAQSGDPAKDYPYFPSLTPAGALPPLQ
jgi:hypothetical protein